MSPVRDDSYGNYGTYYQIDNIENTTDDLIVRYLRTLLYCKIIGSQN